MNREDFFKALNRSPRPEKCKAHPLTGKLYYPIDKVKAKLNYLFGLNWSWEVDKTEYSEGVFYLSGKLIVSMPWDPTQTLTRAGVAAIKIGKKDPHTAFPAANSFALKNAAGHLGRCFRYEDEDLEYVEPASYDPLKFVFENKEEEK